MCIKKFFELNLKLFSRKSNQGGKIILTASQFAQYAALNEIPPVKNIQDKILPHEPKLAG